MAYREEYYGLHNEKQIWTYISEEEYRQLRPAVGNSLLTISLTTINTDANNKPQQAKYCKCVFGNFDPTKRSCNKVFDPVLSQLKLRLLITIAVQKRCKVNAGDFKQAFCQAYFPGGETYVLRPPKDFLMNPPPNTYLQLIRNLYG